MQRKLKRSLKTPAPPLPAPGPHLAGSGLAGLAVAWGVLAWIMLFHGLGSIGLLGPDEPRYAEIAAEMLARHGFVTPRLLDATWFEKPVLYYWLGALGDALGHVSDFWSRLPVACFSLLISAGLYAFLRRTHSRRAGVLGAFLGVTSAFLFAFGRAASTDMPLTAPLALAQMSLFLWLRDAGARDAEGALRGRPWLWLAAASTGIAVLAKGPVALVLEGGSFLLMTALFGRWRWIRQVLAPSAIAILLLVAAPWYIAVSLLHPEFPRQFFLQQNLQRFATNLYQHPQPLWYYVPVLLGAVFPWTGWLLLPLADLRCFLRSRGSERRGLFAAIRSVPLTSPAALKIYMACWALVPFVFFSLSRSKLPGYVLPSVPALVALIAVAAADQWDRLPRLPLAISAVLAGLIPAAIRVLPWGFIPKKERPPVAVLLHDPALWALGLVTVGLLLYLVWKRQSKELVAATCALMAGAILAVTGPYAAHFDAVASARPLAAALARRCGVQQPALTASLQQVRNAAEPLQCGLLPVVAWRLNRDSVYGTEFYLHRTLPDLTGATVWPIEAVAVVERADIGSFEQAAAEHGRQVEEDLNPQAAQTKWEIVTIRTAGEE